MSATALDTLVNAAYSVATLVGIPAIVIWAVRRAFAIARTPGLDLSRDR